MTSYMAKETRDFSAAGTDRACFDRRGRMNECKDGTPKLVGRVYTLKPICDGYK